MLSFISSLFRPLSLADKTWARSVKHFRFLDGFRGVSAICILIWHYQHFYYEQPVSNAVMGKIDRTVQPFYVWLLPFYEYGYWAVQLFWILSGFVFAHVYAARHVSGRAFVLSRFARLYPLHFLTLLFVAAAQFASISMLGGYQVVSFNDPYHFFLNLAFIPGWGFQRGDSFNSPVWSVSVELVIYAIYFFMARRVYQVGMLLPLLMVVISAIIVKIGTPLWIFALCSEFFFAGVILYFFFAKCRTLRWPFLLLSGASLIHFFHMLYRGAISTKPFHDTEGYLLVPLVFLVALLDLRSVGRRAVAVLDFLSSLTYSTYLWHFPVQVLVLTVVGMLGTSRRIFDSPWVLSVWILCMLIVGRLSYIYIERPAQMFILRRFSR